MIIIIIIIIILLLILYYWLLLLLGVNSNFILNLEKKFLAMKSQSLISCFMFRFNPCKYIQCMSLIVIMLFVNFNKSSSLYFPSNQTFILTKRWGKTWTLPSYLDEVPGKEKYSVWRAVTFYWFSSPCFPVQLRVTLTRKYYCALAGCLLSPPFYLPRNDDI